VHCKSADSEIEKKNNLIKIVCYAECSHFTEKRREVIKIFDDIKILCKYAEILEIY
jgi:hypothetical protein